MKKIGIIIMACALTIGLCQCKKTETPNADEGVFITLKASYGQKGEKTGFVPNTSSFVWSEGEEEFIYVGGSYHYGCLGVLNGTGLGTDNITFSGTLETSPSAGETLHFFYLGKGTERTGDARTHLDFSIQDGTLENVTNYHIAIGDAVYSQGIDNYTATLEMKMAIACFDVSGFKNTSDVAETVYLHGDDVFTSAIVAYQDGEIIVDAQSSINIGTANSSNYVALLPSTDSETNLKFVSASKTGEMTFLHGIQAGKHYASSNGALAVTATSGTPEGTIKGLFSVNAINQVCFSQGNLQYQATTNTWRFAENQWDFVGNETEGTVYEGGIKCNNKLVAQNYSGWIDLFCWGTSGYNHGAVYYQPWSTGFSGQYYYAYGNSEKNLYDAKDDGSMKGQADWGYNAICNGGNQENGGWRTLKADEWSYVFDTRTTVSGIRYAKSTVNGVSGIVLLPDDWNSSIYSLNNTNLGDADYSSNVISSDDWTNVFEVKGAVFLPVTGCRTGANFGDADKGFYWSSSYSELGKGYYGTTSYNASTHAWSVYFNASMLGSKTNMFERLYASSVRLVQNAE